MRTIFILMLGMLGMFIAPPKERVSIVLNENPLSGSEKTSEVKYYGGLQDLLRELKIAEFQPGATLPFSAEIKMAEILRSRDFIDEMYFVDSVTDSAEDGVCVKLKLIKLQSRYVQISRNIRGDIDPGMTDEKSGNHYRIHSKYELYPELRYNVHKLANFAWIIEAAETGDEGFPELTKLFRDGQRVALPLTEEVLDILNPKLPHINPEKREAVFKRIWDEIDAAEIKPVAISELG